MYYVYMFKNIKGFIQHHKKLKKRTMGKNGAGFTLIELLVVIAIISILAALLMANFVGVRQRGRDAQRKSELRQIQAALELYRADQGLYLTTGNLPACGNVFSSGGATYMQKIPCDPLYKTSYSYTSDDGTTYILIACIENSNDQDRKVGDTSCNSTTGIVYELLNP